MIICEFQQNLDLICVSDQVLTITKSYYETTGLKLSYSNNLINTTKQVELLGKEKRT